MTETAAFVLRSLGQRLFDARVATGLTVRAAARAIGVDHSMIVRYERGQTYPPLDRLLALAETYGTTAAALLALRAEAMPLIAVIDQADALVLAQLAAALAATKELLPSVLGS